MPFRIIDAAGPTVTRPSAALPAGTVGVASAQGS